MKKNIRQAAAQLLEIPADIACGSLRITLLGRQLLRAENHRGIISYDPARISFAAVEGDVHIYGSELNLAALDGGALAVDGEIQRIIFGALDDSGAADGGDGDEE
ncbi:MAG: YabP/YqfC family sporulation protein [Bacillota bacterium]|nr:YabP/YqfC family sporulation protein [Bacillota bacterium]